MNSEVEQSLVGPLALAAIGTEIARAQGTVVKKEFQRWAAAVGDRNPLYFDDEYARSHGYREAVMPPLYLQQVTLGVVDLDQLRPDGIPGGGGTSARIPLPKTPRWMAGGEDTRFFEPVYDADVITSVRSVVSVEQKQGRSGAFVVITSRVTYTRGDGTVVAEATMTTIARP
jgi:acyl dehydratase